MDSALQDRLHAIKACFIDDDLVQPPAESLCSLRCCISDDAASSTTSLFTPLGCGLQLQACDALLAEVGTQCINALAQHGIGSAICCFTPRGGSLALDLGNGCSLVHSIGRALQTTISPGRALLSALELKGNVVVDLIPDSTGCLDASQHMWVPATSFNGIQQRPSTTTTNSPGVRLFRLAQEGCASLGPFITILDFPIDHLDPDPLSSTVHDWHGLAAILEAISLRLPLVPYSSSPLGRLLPSSLQPSTSNHLILDLRKCPHFESTLSTTLPSLLALAKPLGNIDKETVQSCLSEGALLLSASTADSALPADLLQRCFDFEAALLRTVHEVGSAKPMAIDGQHRKHPNRTHQMLCYTTSQLTLESEYRALAFQLLEECQLRSKAEQVLIRAQAEQQVTKAVQQLQATHARLERELQGLTLQQQHPYGPEGSLTRGSSFTSMPRARSERVDDVVTKVKESLLQQSSCREVPKEEIERQIEVLENLYEARRHSEALVQQNLSGSPPSCVELQKVIQGLHEDLLEKGLQLYCQGEEKEQLRRDGKAAAEQLADLQKAYRRVHRLWQRCLGLATGLFDFAAMNVSCEKVIKGSAEMLPPFIRGLEAILADGLLEGSTLWDFVEHTQKTMADKGARRNFVNSGARQQVTAVLQEEREGLPLTNTERSQLWLLHSLTQRSLLDAITSLDALQPAYYHPTAFSSTSEGAAFLMATLRLINRLPFKLGRADLACFDSCRPESPALFSEWPEPGRQDSAGSSSAAISKSPGLTATQPRLTPVALTLTSERHSPAASTRRSSYSASTRRSFLPLRSRPFG